MDAILPWILKLAGGAVGGNLIGGVLKKLSLGALGNTIVGMLGGGIGAELLKHFGVIAQKAGEAGGSFDLTEILTQVGAGGAGGGVLMTVIGVLKSMLGGGKKK